MKPIRNILNGLTIVSAVWLLCGIHLIAQPCYTIDTLSSKINLTGQGLDTQVGFPTNGSIVIPCSKTITGFTLAINYENGVENFFENMGTPLISASLSYNNNGNTSTNIMAYNSTDNTFSISANPPTIQFGSGIYTFSVSANCATDPPGSCTCVGSTLTFTIVHGLSVDVTPNTPPTLGCGANATRTLMGTPPPGSGVTGQWARYNVSMAKFEDINGATSAMYGAQVAGLYRYTAIGNGCSGSDTISVNPAPPPPSITVTPNITVNECTTTLNFSIINMVLSGQGSSPTFQWSTAGSGTILNNTNTAQYPTIGGAGVYTVILMNTQTGCIASATLTVANSPNLATVSVTINKSKAQLGCSPTHNTMDLTAMPVISTGTSTFKYSWNTGATVDKITVNTAGNFTVTVTADVNNCKASASVTVDQDITKPTVSVTATKDVLCAGDSTRLTATASETVSYKWSTVGNPTTMAIPVVPGSPGNNTYTVTVTAADNGCTATGTKTIQRLARPDLSCTDATYTVNNGDTRSFTCNVTNGELEWSSTAVNVKNIPATGTGALQNQVFELDKAQAPGLVQFTLYGSNDACSADTVHILVNVLPETANGIFIPELITPNGDGTNDTWEIKVDNTVDNAEAYNIMLFNRYGAQIYSGSLLAPFDGTACPDGPYIWVLTSPTGEKTRGTVTIIRR